MVLKLELGTLWFRMPKCQKMNVTNNFTIQQLIYWIGCTYYPVPIGNFFSKRELFYLTHIHDHCAEILTTELLMTNLLWEPLRLAPLRKENQ